MLRDEHCVKSNWCLHCGLQEVITTCRAMRDDRGLVKQRPPLTIVTDDVSWAMHARTECV